MSYYTPPPQASTTSQWPYTQDSPQRSITASASQSTPQSATPQSPTDMQNSMAAMMALVQQMQQNFPQNFRAPYPSQQQMPTPVLEAHRMTAPKPSDDKYLSEVLYEQTSNGLTYKAALESLHGHNGIAAFAWKDYYLEHKQRIDSLVDKLAPRTTVPPVTFERESSTTIPNGNHTQATKNESSSKPVQDSTNGHSVKKRRASTPISTSRKLEKQQDTGKGKANSNPAVAPERSSSRRRTLNSLSSAPSSTLLAKIPTGVAIDADTGLPAAPPRSPSPPTVIIAHQTGRGFQKFTDEDARYFFRRIAYDLARDPDLNKAQLCDLLAEKAPHHTSLSWRTYWNKHEDVADKMMLLTQLDDEDRVEVIRSWKTGTSVAKTDATPDRKKARVAYAESSSSESSSQSNSGSSSFSELESGSDDDDALGSTDDDEEFGEAGSPFGNAEIRALAKHIASKREWFDGVKEWNSFLERHPQRTPASWKEYYRRKAKEIDVLAKKFMKRAQKQQPAVTKQRGKPSWATQGRNVHHPEGSSGKHRLDHLDRKRSEEKRARYASDVVG